MDDAKGVPLQGILGYLNFSEGRSDPRVARQLDDAFASFTGPTPWTELGERLSAELAALRSAGGAFRETTQAEAVLRLAFQRVLPEYRRFHADLLFHQSDADLFRPYFIVRVLECVLAQGAPWNEEERIVEGALRQLNDFAGHRPVAILETRPRGEPDEHEKVRPIPLFIRGAGVARGRYRELIEQGLEILANTERDLLSDAGFDPALLDELALDPRAYDFNHPANRRPNYLFGEWDPHHIDNQGRFRRYVARQVTLDALLDRVDHPGELDRAEVLAEAATVFAGTLLMATAMSGYGPGALDSTVTLTTLTPRVARLRDAFYQQRLKQLPKGSAHTARLQEEATQLRQPYAGARQHLNAQIARQRALQLQQRHLSILFAEMGYPKASRAEVAQIPAPSARMQSEILGRLTTGVLLVDRGDLTAAAALLPETEEHLKRGIACGALADPWNVLGFQGLFPIFASREDAVRDGRIHELVAAVERLFVLYARVSSEAAARGDSVLVESVLSGMKRLAGWWDQFATATVSEVRPVLGGEAASSAEEVAQALAAWHARGEATADLPFWRQHLEGFRSPKAFALVVETLLRKADYRAAQGLLVSWLSQADEVALEDGEYSFHGLTLRWVMGLTSGVTSLETGASAGDPWPMVRHFLDALEANAGEYWQVPALEVDYEPEEAEDDDEDDLFGAAYEGMTYRDTTDDSEGAVADGSEPGEEFDLESEAERLTTGLQFLTTVARIWHIAARKVITAAPSPDQAEAFGRWLAVARENRERLLALLDAVHAQAIPQPIGGFDAMVEYDRRRGLKDQLVHNIISTCLETEMSLGALEGALLRGETPPGFTPSAYARSWGLPALALERAIQARDPQAVRAALPAFLKQFRREPLLFTALSDGGDPRTILRVRLAQALLRALATVLPRLGLLRETYQLLTTALRMESVRPPQGRGVTEFNELFQTAFRGAVECVVDSAANWDPAVGGDAPLVDLLDGLTTPFVGLWIKHARSLGLSVLESLNSSADWDALRAFITTYGRDLFDARFLTPANLRGILHRGIPEWLEELRENPDPLKPLRLLDELDTRISRDDAAARLRVIFQAILEHYEEYKDYNATTTQSDYGDNLHVLFDFLRLKVSYQRHAWYVQPRVMVHDALARKGRTGAALEWEESFAELTREAAAQHLEELARLEREHRIRLSTVADRLQERFIKPLALDRLCALVEPSMREARAEAAGSFERLQGELGPLAATPTGAGLDVPAWLRRLEAEVQRARAATGAVFVLAESLFRVSQVSVTYDEVRRQVQGWENTANDE